MRAGEDARVSLERARERCQNINGRDLDQDFTAIAPQTLMGTRSQTGVPLAGVGCAALADHLRATLKGKCALGSFLSILVIKCPTQMVMC